MQDTPLRKVTERGQVGISPLSCPFCAEIQAPLEWVHASAYNQKARITAPSASLRILPTLGQIVPGSLLLLPVRHVERYADLAPALRAEAVVAARETVARFEMGGKGWVMFEHGALASGGGGCGLYHAHLHLVPVENPPTAEELLPKGQGISGLHAGWDSVDTTDDYLICASADGSARFLSVTPAERTEYPSQFFRRQLHRVLRLEGPWDWREFKQPESAIERWIERVPRSDGVGT